MSSGLTDRIQASLAADVTVTLAAIEKRNPMPSELPADMAREAARVSALRFTEAELTALSEAVGCNGVINLRADLGTGRWWLIARPQSYDNGVWHVIGYRCARCKSRVVRDVQDPKQADRRLSYCVVCGLDLATFEEVSA
jgi:alkylation response protein AidB-like acyl-CoA dehydrogenase